MDSGLCLIGYPYSDWGYPPFKWNMIWFGLIKFCHKLPESLWNWKIFLLNHYLLHYPSILLSQWGSNYWPHASYTQPESNTIIPQYPTVGGDRGGTFEKNEDLSYNFFNAKQ